MIREAFLIHKHILGQSDDVNLANALAADEAFAERLVVPRLERFKGMLNNDFLRSEEHTSELQSLMRISYAVFCLKKKKKQQKELYTTSNTSYSQPIKYIQHNHETHTTQ